ncbi:flagellar assembly protein FliH [Shewanella sp.]|uniref:flagellar assembly protein FliH n=1 Tax=Shewanella sp. TaxID=50422 RepID=UPI003A986B39
MAEHEQAHERDDESQNEVSPWDLPDVGASLIAPETNVFGRKSVQHQPVEPPKKILPPTLAEIEQIRAEAEQEGIAQGHAEGLQKGIEEGRLQGLQEGHAEGFEQGKEQGLAEGLAAAEQKLQQFDELLAQFHLPLALLDNQVEQSLLALVQTLAKQTLHHELNTHADIILSALRAGIDALPMREQRVSVRLHPEDVTLVSELYGEDQLAKNQWLLEKDPGLSRGSCIVSCERSQVDMQLEQRIATVFAGVEQRQQQLTSEQHELEQQLPTPQPNAAVEDSAPEDNDDATPANSTAE